MEKKPASALPEIEWGVASRALAGQVVSGDMHLIQPFPGGVLLAVVDGLGHGDEATAAARIAIHALSQMPNQPLVSLIHHCNQALEQTRGVVMTLASLDLREHTLVWMGIGNVEGLLLRAKPAGANPSESVLLRGGVLGFHLPTLKASVLPLSRGDLLIFTTDGVRTGFMHAFSRTDSPKQIAHHILERFYKGTDDALVLVVRYLGSSS